MPSVHPEYPSARPLPTVCHIILRLETGGAEQSLLRLLEGSKERLSHTVVCLGGVTPIAAEIAALGVPLHCLQYRQRGPLALWKARRLLRRLRPDVVQGWMYWGNVLSSLLRPHGSRLSWNVRSSIATLADERFMVRWSVRASRWCLRRRNGRPDLIIYNSASGRASHERLGFATVAGRVIDNGLDLDVFTPDEAARAEVRDRYGLEGIQWIGMVSRYHPVKGVAQFVEAAARIVGQRGGAVRFVLVGAGMNEQNAELVALIARCGLPSEQIVLAGEVRPISRFLPALDLLVVASLREGSPNALLEAMACEVNVVATDVGDVRRILQDDARIARPGDVADLALKVDNALALDAAARDQLVRAGRTRIAQFFSADVCIEAYVDCYESLVSAA